MTEITRRGLGRAAAAGALGAAAGPFPAFAQGANPIRIGFSMSLSGGLAANGRSALLAQKIWAEERERQGRHPRPPGAAGVL